MAFIPDSIHPTALKLVRMRNGAETLGWYAFVDALNEQLDAYAKDNDPVRLEAFLVTLLDEVQ